MDELCNSGVALLRGVIHAKIVGPLRSAAEACFHAVESGRAIGHGYTSFSSSTRIAALRDHGVASDAELLAPLATPELIEALSFAIEQPVSSLDDSWVRKRFAPTNAPQQYHPNSWHQDGGLRVAYPRESAAAIPMTRLATCWVPLDNCGRDAPGMEFVLERLDNLLHYSELDDSRLRRRFAPNQFWAPELEVGDALVFLAGSLHRTYVRREMRQNRLSLEYRFFPAHRKSTGAITMES